MKPTTAYLHPGGQELQWQIEDKVLQDILSSRSGPARVAVTAGVVTIVGRLERKSEIPPVTHLARDLRGVVAVDNRLD